MSARKLINRELKMSLINKGGRDPKDILNSKCQQCGLKQFRKPLLTKMNTLQNRFKMTANLNIGRKQNFLVTSA